MGRAYSMDLRERVVAAVAQEGLSRRQAATRFGVSDSTAINWLKRVATTGSVAPGQIGGHKPKKIAGPHRDGWSGAAGSGTSPCAGSWLSSPSAASRSTTARSGSSSTPRSSVIKKTLIAAEQDRPDVAR